MMFCAGSYPELPANLNRDKNADHSKRMGQILGAAEQKYGLKILSSLVLFSYIL